MEKRMEREESLKKNWIVRETTSKWHKQVPYKWWKSLNVEQFQEILLFSTLNKEGDPGGDAL